MKNKVAIYLRLSDEDKQKTNKFDNSESIKNQRNMLLEEIKKHPDFILFDEYCDENLSGAGTFRPEFERLIRDCEQGKIDIILCKSQSRFSRDMEVIEKYIHNKFIEWNVRFISLTDNIDTNSPGNKKSRQINGLVNEWYLEDTSNNIRSAFKTKMENGEFISPFAAYGYEISKKNNNKLVIDPIAAVTVKEIYNLYLKGMGFTSIANYLNKKNIPCPSLYKYQKGVKLNILSNKPREQIKWSSNAIKTILTNELYIGNLLQGKRTTISYKNHKIIKKNKKDWVRKENTHEAIIDKDLFEKVQNAIKERAKPVKSTGIVHNFSGKVFCLECKKCMRKKSTKSHEYLVCSNYSNSHFNCSNKKSIRFDILENIVLEAINNKLKIYFDKNYLLKYKQQFDEKNNSEKLCSLKNKRLEIMKKILETKIYLKTLYEDKVNKLITLEQFNDLLYQYDNYKEIYYNQIKLIENEINIYISKQNFNTKIKKYKKFDKLNKVIIDEFVEKIYIGKLNKKTNIRDVQIIWNFFDI